MTLAPGKRKTCPMPLKRTAASQDEIPEALRSLYVLRDGQFVLDLDGDPGDDALKALERERKARAEAERALKELKGRLGDLDPVKAREALQMIADMEAKALLGDLPPPLAAKVEELVAKRTERIAADAKAKEQRFQASLETETVEKTRLQKQLEEILIDNTIRNTALKAGVQPTAVEDAVLYAKTVWKLKDGKPTAMKGEEILYGKKPNEPMTPEEWIAERAADRPHWFQPSAGTGTLPGAGRPGTEVVLPREQAKDINAYRAARDQAQKAGVPLVVR